MLEHGLWIKTRAQTWVEDLVLRLRMQGIDAMEYLMRTPRSQLPPEQRSAVQADLHVSPPCCFISSYV